MNVYLDNCCLNRLLDDRSYSQIYYERNSVMLILELAEQKAVELTGSQMLVKEIEETKDLYRRSILRLVYGLVSREISVDMPILRRAEEIRRISNIKYKDSIHLACAEAAGADALLTTDKKFLNNCNRIHTYTKVMNPSQWLMEVLY